MKNSIRLLACSIFIQMFATSGANAALALGSVLKFASPVFDIDGLVVGGSFFSFDMNGNNNIELSERMGMTPDEGIIVGTPQLASGYAGMPTGFGPPSIDEPWSFFGNTGMHLSVAGVSPLATSTYSASGSTVYLDMSGWGITWGGIPMVTLGSGTWGSNLNGEAVVTCVAECTVGDTFSLYYTATVPSGDPSGFGGLRYRLGMDPNPLNVIQPLGFAQATAFSDSDPGMVLTGTIAAPSSVPLPAAVWLLGSGLLGLVGMARRKAT